MQTLTPLAAVSYLNGMQYQQLKLGYTKGMKTCRWVGFVDCWIVGQVSLRVW